MLSNIDYTGHELIPGQEFNERHYELAFVCIVSFGLVLAVLGMFSLVQIANRLGAIRDRVEDAQSNLSLEDVVTVLVEEVNRCEISRNSLKNRQIRLLNHKFSQKSGACRRLR